MGESREGRKVLAKKRFELKPGDEIWVETIVKSNDSEKHRGIAVGEIKKYISRSHVLPVDWKIMKGLVMDHLEGKSEHVEQDENNDYSERDEHGCVKDESDIRYEWVQVHSAIGLFMPCDNSEVKFGDIEKARGMIHTVSTKGNKSKLLLSIFDDKFNTWIELRREFEFYEDATRVFGLIASNFL